MRGYSRWFGASLAVMLSLHGLSTAAYATVAAPEIDASAIPVGIALLAGGVLMLRARRGGRK